MLPDKHPLSGGIDKAFLKMGAKSIRAPAAGRLFVAFPVSVAKTGNDKLTLV